MKKLFIVLAILATSTTALADDWVGVARNTGGGKIVFMTVKGGCKDGNVVYSTQPNKGTLWGCWVAMDLHVLVLWSDGDARTYEYSAITANPNWNREKSDPATTRF